MVHRNKYAQNKILSQGDSFAGFCINGVKEIEVEIQKQLCCFQK